MKMNTTFRRFLSLALVLSVLLGWVLPANALDLGVNFRQVSNDRVSGGLFDRESANIQEDVKRYADSDSVRVSIILEEAGTIDAGFKPEGIAFNKAAMEYRACLKSAQVNVVEEIEDATDEELDVVWYMTLAANLISANVKYGQVDEIAKVSGVKAVVVEEPYDPSVVNSSVANPNMATSGVQTGAPITHAAGYTGAGTRIAVIDTGVDVDHISFDAGAFNYSLANLAGKKNMSPDEYIAGLDLLDMEEIAAVLDDLNIADLMEGDADADDLYVNTKIPFGFNYVDVDLDITHENDSQGSHGSHVAGIASANTYVPKGDGSYADAISTVFAQGVAPDAQLIVMKVFGKAGGAYSSDYMAAIEDAIMLGADSINLSLGSGSAGFSYETEVAYQMIMDNLVNSGAVVCISAGNNGGWADYAENGIPYLYLDDVNMQTGGSPGSYTNSLGIASVDNAGFISPTIVVGNDTVAYNETNYSNAPMETVAGDVEYVFLNGIGEGPDFDALGVSLQDKLVLCYRGTTSFFEKANAAASRGAKAVAIVNNQAGIINMDLTGYTYTVPVVSLLQVDGEAFKTNGTPIYGPNNEILGWTGTAKIDGKTSANYYGDAYYTMSSFSSWGVPGDLTMKPEIAAPGGEIHSVGGANWNGEMMVYGDHASYEVMSGTSMAAPQVAGMAALVAQYIKENKLDEKNNVNVRALAQSLLMSTAVPILDGNNGGYYYPVIQQGAGLANVSAAVSADSYLMMGADATASYADGKVKVELGDDPAKKGEYTFTFYINNLTNEEKTYLLSADFFTQDAFSYNNALYMDTWTRPLAPNVTWMVNGKPVDTGADLVGMDFNGDGYINSNDGQALLDLAVGVRESVENAALADIDKDNDVDSHDAYLFFQMLGENGAVVPANGKTEVQVTVKLTDNDKAWLAYYENGAYLEGYVYAESMVSDEGVEGTSHSIPVLGFYGNWSDASMYDKGSYVEYAHGEETRPPYLYGSNYRNGNYNGFTVSYSDDPSSQYWFGGNPYITDDVYMPERNAINTSDTLKTLGFSLIRNAAQIYLYIQDPVSGGYYKFQSIGEDVTAAYYSPSSDIWKSTYYKLNLGLNFAGLPSGTPLEVGIASIPEYYVDGQGNVAWNALGDGAFLSMPMVIDGEAPVVQDVDIVNDTMTVTIKDNQYIAAIALYDSFGQYRYLAEGSKDQNAGDTVIYTLDLTQVNGASFLLQVYDYACNTATYEINDPIGEVVNTVESVAVSEDSVVMQKGTTKALSAVVYPVNVSNRAVTWKSSDESVVSVDANGKLTANAVGTATITAAAAADETKTATCVVEVVDISANLNGIVWDENGSIWFSEFAVNDLPNYTKLSPDMYETGDFVSAAVGADGTLYASTLDTSNGTGSLYAIDPVTYEATFLADCNAGIDLFYSDLTYVPAMFGTGMLLGTYGPYVIAIDPVTGAALGAIDKFDSDLVGIATCYGQYDPDSGIYQDVVYVIQNDGTIIQEIYFGYDGLLGVYSENYNEGERFSFDSGISVGDAWYFNSAYYDGNYLYWSAFNQKAQNAVTLYAIDADYTGKVYNLGQFGEGVWPVGGLYQAPSAPPAGSNAVNYPEISADVELKMKSYDIAAYAASKKQAPAANDDVRPMSDAVVEEAQDMITVKVTAGDLQATATDCFNNGVSSVTYDAEALELKSILVNGDYVASKKEDGKVTFGYVDLDGVDKDAVVATLVFEAKSSDAKPVKVTYLETNNTKPGSTEDVEVTYPHKNTELINVDEASCTEPGYTGDIYCHDCDSIITKGKEIKPTGHQHTEIRNAKDATYTEPGYTGDTYCLDCKQVVAKGKEIPVKTAEGSGPPKTDDPFFFGMGIVVMMTAVSAMAVLTVVYKKKYRN